MKREITIVLLSLSIAVTAMARGTQQRSRNELQIVKRLTLEQIIDKYGQAAGGEVAFKNLTLSFHQLH